VVAKSSEQVARGADGTAEDGGSGELLQALLAEHPRATTRDGYGLELRGADDGPEELRLVAPNGRLVLTIVLAPEGPRVEVDAASLHVRASERVRFDADRIELAAREGIELVSGGEIRHRAAGTITSEAFEHHVEATHGEIRLHANDDVALEGERIRLNSPSAPLPPHLRGTRSRQDG
jgi:hypothetical protein